MARILDFVYPPVLSGGQDRLIADTVHNGAFWTWPSQLVAGLDTAGYSGGRLDLQQFVLAAPFHVLRLGRPGMLASAGRRRSPARTQIRHCQRRDPHLGGALSRAVPRACAQPAIAGYAMVGGGFAPTPGPAVCISSPTPGARCMPSPGTPAPALPAARAPCSAAS